MSPKLAPIALAAATPRGDKPIKCGFCKDGHHDHCPRAVANGSGKIWPCACDDPSCGGGSILRCLQCKHEGSGEISPAMWECIDPEACQVRQQRRLDNNPYLNSMKEYTTVPTVKEKAAAKKTAPAKPKPEPRDCACGCGAKTGGGTFRPGHDATLVKNTVLEVAGANFTVKAKTNALRNMKAVGASDALIAKYEKLLAAAQSRGAAAAAKAVTKPAAKKAAAKKVASGKASTAPVEDDDVEDDDGF